MAEGTMAVNITVTIDGVEYGNGIVEAFLKAKGKKDVQDLPRRWFEQHLITFNEGFDCGYEVASGEAPNCDECDIYGKVADAGPPESHYSQQDR